MLVTAEITRAVRLPVVWMYPGSVSPLKRQRQNER
jgi:hypothetical protein